ncbi:hypothetical protein niasHT_001812 [Heterodera trifolii]|uniref:Uncharacterized protein n=1 Tax=Heterodera trifolii TaxID=157864 RepID=A0ABD2MBK8_9BILA
MPFPPPTVSRCATVSLPFPPLFLFPFFFPLLFLSAQCALYNRFSPTWEKPEIVTVSRQISIKIELMADFGTNNQMKMVARKAILSVFSGTWPTTGDESNYIGEIMEKQFGGRWMVGIFDIDFDAAYTIVRRSPSYMLFGVNNRAILIAREGNGKRAKISRLLTRRK